MPTLQYLDNPNTETAFAVQDSGKKNRVILTAAQDTSTLELPDNPNSTKGYVTIAGKKHRVILIAEIMGGGLPAQTGHAGEFLTTNGSQASWGKVLENITGYDATKTQVLKNIQGVLTWVNE